jgi:hypothetical protein
MSMPERRRQQDIQREEDSCWNKVSLGLSSGEASIWVFVFIASVLGYAIF